VKARYAAGGILVAALLALPASAAAGQGGQVSALAAQECAQERADIGKRAFRKRYGAKRAMRSCVKRHRGQVAAAISSAGQDCQAELGELGVAGFVEEWGDEPTDSLDYAMAECIDIGVDQILNPEDWVDDDSDEEE
jgi:hypothetical protein